MNTEAFASGLRYDELEQVADQFGVAAEQVHRDHLISRLLAGIAASPLAESLIFIGGTALTRTWLPGLRLSEDIDLLLTRRAHDQVGRHRIAAGLEESLERAVARSHGRLLWAPRLTDTRGADSASVATDSGLRVRVQLLAPIGYPEWPTVVRDIEQRYSDVGAARLSVLTPAGFVAAKTSAWLDRAEARDLYDLWALAEAGYIDAGAVRVYTRTGPTGKTPVALGGPPSAAVWDLKLGHQCRIAVDPASALRTVQAAWLECSDAEDL